MGGWKLKSWKDYIIASFPAKPLSRDSGSPPGLLIGDMKQGSPSLSFVCRRSQRATRGYSLKGLKK